MCGSRYCENQDGIAFSCGLPDTSIYLEANHIRSAARRAGEGGGLTGEILYVPITFILFHQLIELITRYKLDDLGEHELALIHNLDASEQQD